MSAVATFFLAMALFPDAQKKAQEEIDRVIGTHRLPDFDDRESLPYCEALYREVMRWRPVLPLNVSHTASEDGIYKGYFIPKGMLNQQRLYFPLCDSLQAQQSLLTSGNFNHPFISTARWFYRAMVHDESVYPQPDVFIPDRFMTQDGQVNDNDTILAFGFGRRY